MTEVVPRLWRSTENKVVAGVLGGLAERFRMDATFIRVLFAALTLFSGAFPGVFIYLVLWWIASPRSVERQ
ncbi:MAG: PspC domain-containing protein [Gemmatimonadaceae bacterium]